MKRSLIAILALITLSASLGTASADQKSDYKLALDQYRSALANWNLVNKTEQADFISALNNWNTLKSTTEQARKDIAAKFKSDAESIMARTKLAVDLAIKAKDKKAANLVGKTELDLAISLRNSALDAIAKLGPRPIKPTPAPAPTPPVKPTLPTKIK